MSDDIDGSWGVVPFLGPIVNFAKLASELAANIKVERRRIYSEIFVPEFENLENIHRDYMNGFKTFLESCRTMKVPNNELVRQILYYGQENRNKRADAKRCSESLSAISRKFKSGAQRAALADFAAALSHYFDASDWQSSDLGTKQSWFTQILTDIENITRQGRSPWDTNFDFYIAGGNVRDSFVDTLSLIYRDVLPARWDALALARDKIRAAFFV